ncbi:hypothetical protein Bbelb_131670 [Branchiostoma belcheri]|nr:hypothetical protein Bbelb_131670 [Branchiostoma belcheri]
MSSQKKWIFVCSDNGLHLADHVHVQHVSQQAGITCNGRWAYSGLCGAVLHKCCECGRNEGHRETRQTPINSHGSSRRQRTTRLTLFSKQSVCTLGGSRLLTEECPGQAHGLVRDRKLAAKCIN